MKQPAESAGNGVSLYFLAAVVFVALSMHLPVSLFATAGHDDALFVTNADHIVTGHWLGPFTQLTLAKGPTYSLFLAINALLGIPVTLPIAVLYALACWVLVRALNKSGLPRIWAFGLFVALLFQPALFPTRIIRDNVYPALTLLSVAGVIGVGRLQHSVTRSMLFGFILGMFWMTREEGVWILPAFALYFLFAFVSNKQLDGSRRHLLRNLGAYLLAAFMPCIAVSGMNYLKYDTFEVVDSKGPFEKALERLNSVVGEQEIPHVPVPQAKRELIYQVSPAFRELKSYFENAGRAWTEPGCQIYPGTCGDYAGGWFMWALRDAVADRGSYRTPQQAKDFYRKIADEIASACKSGAVHCRSTLLPFVPAIPPESLARLPATTFKALQVTLYLTAVPSTDGTNNGFSLGGTGELNKTRLFLGNPRNMPSTAEASFQLTGWFQSGSNDWIALECSTNGLSNRIPIARKSSPDLAAHFNDTNAGAERFSLVVKKSDNCRISLENQTVSALPIEALVKNDGASTALGDGVLNLDYKFSDLAAFEKPLATKQWLASVYRWITPAIAGFGVLCYLSCLVLFLMRKRAPGNLFWIASMLWLLYLSRVVVIVLVDVSSFPAVNYLYLGPILPILYAAAVVSMAYLLTPQNL